MRHTSSYARTLAGLVVATLPCTALADTYTFSITPPESLELIDGVNGLTNITSGTFNLTGLIGYSQTETTGLILLDPDDPLDDISQPATIGSGVKMGLLEVDSEFEVLMATGFFESPVLSNDANFEAIVGAVRPTGPTDYTLYLPSDTTQPLRTQLTSLELEPLDDNTDVFVEVGLLLDPTIQIAPSMGLLNPDAEVFELNGDPLDGTPTWFVGIGGENDPGGTNGGGGSAASGPALAGMKPHGTIAIGGCIRGSLCTATWSGGAGDWNTPSQWDIGLVPFNGNFDNSTFNVLIDNGAGGNSTTTLANTVQVVNLTVSTGDTLNLGGALGITGGTLTNQGEIVMNNTTSKLDVIDTLTLTGGGEVIIHDPSALIRQFSGTGGLINTDNTIRGHGSINTPLTNNATVRAEEGTLNLPTTNNSAGVIEIAADGTLNLTGTVTGGTVHAELGGLISGTGLKNLTTTGTLAITRQDLRIEGTITNDGVMTFEDAAISTENLFLLGDTTLAGTGDLILNSNLAGIQPFSGTPTLTNTNTIRGHGTIGVPVVNQHVIRSESGVLNLGTTDNSAGVIQITSGSTLNLTSTVTGGTVSASSGSLIQGTRLKDLTTSGTLTIPRQDLVIEGTITNTGTITYENAGVSNEDIFILGDTNLAGTGELILNSNLARISIFSGIPTLTSTNTIRGQGSINVSMINQGTIRAEGGLLNLGTTDNTAGMVEIAPDGELNITGIITGGTVHTEPGGLIHGSRLQDLTTTGVLTITRQDLTIDGSITNNGVISFENAGISTEDIFVFADTTLAGTGEVLLNSNLARISIFSGTPTLTSTNTIRGQGSINVSMINQGTIRAEGGPLILAATDNTAGTIQVANDATLNVTGLITGGTVHTELGGAIHGSRLKDLTTTGTLTVSSLDLTIEGVINNTDVITFENNPSAAIEDLFLLNTITLDGGGEVILNSSDARIRNASGTTTLTNASNLIRGQGMISPTHLINQSTIRAEGGQLSINASTFDNTAGAIEVATGATLSLGASTTNNAGGTIDIADGGTLNISGLVTGGTVTGAAGSLISGNRLIDLTTTGALTINTSDLSLEGTITNTGVITFENNPGTSANEWLFLFGNVMLNGGGELVLNNTDASIQNGSMGSLTNIDNTIRGFNTINVPVTNQATIRAESGLLSLSAVDNTTGTIQIAPDGILQFTTITNGQIANEAGSRIQSGKLVDTTTSGTMTVNTLDLSLEGTITNNDVITFENNTGTTADETLFLFGNVSLDGAGQVILNSVDATIQNGNMGTLTNIDNTIRGFGTIGVPVVNQNDIIVENGTLNLAATDNSSGMIKVATGGTLNLTGTLSGGNLNFMPDGFVLGRIKDLTTSGTMVVKTTDINLEGTITNTDVITFENNTGTTADETLFLFGDVTLDGGGEVVLNSIDATIQNGNLGTLTNIDNTIRGQGTIGVPMINESVVTAQGGKLTINATDVGGDGSMFVEAGAELEFNGGTLHQHTISVDAAGEFDFNGTRLEVVDFIGSVTLESGDTYAPGSSPAISSIDGSFTMINFTTLEIDVLTPATTAGDDYDQLNVTGPVTLDGTLMIVPEDGLTAVTGTEMTVMTFPSRTGAFDALEGSLVDTGLALVPAYGDTDITLRASIPGDVNFDDSVSVADLSTLALNFNTNPGLFDEVTGIHSWALGDFNGDGSVTVADLSLLALNFGIGTESTGEAIGLSLEAVAAMAGIHPADVPEPGAAVTLGVCIAAGVSRRRRVAG